MKRYGRSGWYGERHRHYLAAKGISSKRYLANLNSNIYGLGMSDEDWREANENSRKYYEALERKRAGRRLLNQIKLEEDKKKYQESRDANRFERYWEGLQLDDDVMNEEEERARKSIEEKGIIGKNY